MLTSHTMSQWVCLYALCSFTSNCTHSHKALSGRIMHATSVGMPLKCTFTHAILWVRERILLFVNILFWVHGMRGEGGQGGEARVVLHFMHSSDPVPSVQYIYGSPMWDQTLVAVLMPIRVQTKFAFFLLSDLYICTVSLYMFGSGATSAYTCGVLWRGWGGT